jgi:flagellar hook assembly protein FlgD
MTVINYTITHQGVVNLVVFDMLGRKVTELVQQSQNPGSYQVIWNGQNSMGFPVSSGVYLYKITAGKFTETRKMILVR